MTGATLPGLIAVPTPLLPRAVFGCPMAVPRLVPVVVPSEVLGFWPRLELRLVLVLLWLPGELTEPAPVPLNAGVLKVWAFTAEIVKSETNARISVFVFIICSHPNVWPKWRGRNWGLEPKRNENLRI